MRKEQVFMIVLGFATSIISEPNPLRKPALPVRDVGYNMSLKPKPKLVVELGMAWEYCSGERGLCHCITGIARFGSAERWVFAYVASPSETISCSVQGFGHDPYVGAPKECWCKRTGVAPHVPARVAIVTRSNRPHNLIPWINYHLEVAGVEHIYIEILADVKVWQHVTLNIAQKNKLTVRNATQLGNYFQLREIENSVVNWAIGQAEHMRMDWLVHFDDDEFVFSPEQRSVGDIFAYFPDSVEQVHFPNVEALFESDHVQNCYTEAKYFNMNGYTYVAYANGKSAARIEPRKGGRLKSFGPHFFARQSYPQNLDTCEIKRSKTTEAFPFGPPLLLLHVESCPFEAWKQKYLMLAQQSSDAGLKYIARFPFQDKSLHIMMKCQNASTSRYEPLCSDASLRNFWAEFKVRGKRTRRAQDLTLPIQIPWERVFRTDHA